MNHLQNIIDQIKGKRVVVLADLVADVFLHGEIARISREAPVLILNHRDTKLVPGGGANAIHNVWALGGIPYPIGIVGEDKEGDQLIMQFTELGIDVSGIERLARYRTPTKMRVLAEMPHGYRQQVVRIDWGEKTVHNQKTIGKIKKRLQAALKNTDAFLISDYGYGTVVPEMIATLPARSIPTTLDSRFSLDQFIGMTSAAPNESEVEAVLGITIGNDIQKLELAGQTLRKKLKQNALLITRGKEGMALFEEGKKPVHIPIHGSDEVADVTGAGDTVIATFTLALATGCSFYQAALLANLAGGLVVMKYGTATVSPQELSSAVLGYNQ